MKCSIFRVRHFKGLDSEDHAYLQIKRKSASLNTLIRNMTPLFYIFIWLNISHIFYISDGPINM